MSKKNVVLKMLSAGAVLAGLVQADPVSMVSTQVNSYNTWWQEIVGASWEDATGDNIIEVGEEVTFTITMDKQFRGDHDYDALKVWMDNVVVGAPSTASGQLLKDSGYEFMWDATGGGWNSDPYNGPVKDFSFKYTFNAVGTYDLTASVMCSRDLSALFGSSNDQPTTYDFSLWQKDTKRYQGETEKFQVTVTQNVPEPTILSLLGCGLLGMAFIRRKK